MRMLSIGISNIMWVAGVINEMWCKMKLEKVSIGHGCQNAIQKKVTYVIVTQHEVIIKVDMAHTQFATWMWNLVKGR